MVASPLVLTLGAAGLSARTLMNYGEHARLKLSIRGFRPEHSAAGKRLYVKQPRGVGNGRSPHWTCAGSSDTQSDLSNEGAPTLKA